MLDGGVSGMSCETLNVDGYEWSRTGENTRKEAAALGAGGSSVRSGMKGVKGRTLLLPALVM